MVAQQFFNPENEKEVKRRMRLAKALQDASQVPQAPAGTVVSDSPWAALARGVAGGIGDYQERMADETMTRDAADRQKFLQSAVQQYGNNPKMLAQALMTQPSTADAGLGLYGDVIKGDQMSAYQAAMLGLQNQKFQAEYPTDPNTGLPKKEQKISVRDEMRMAKSEEGAQAAQRVEQLASEARDILGRYETNRAAPIIGGFNRILAATPLASAETKKAATDYESLDRISKELGVQTLAQFGGNDTDKELQVAIQSNVDPSATVETNLATINRKLAAANILQQKPDFEAKWVAKNGGLNRLDRDTGRSFQSEWLAMQREMYKNATQAKPAANDLTEEELQFLQSRGINPNANQ